MRIIYFGTPEFAVPSLQRLIASRHEVAALVSQPDRPKGRGHQLAATATKQVALGAGVPVLQPERLRDEAFLDSLRVLNADLGVVAAYGRILPDALLAIPHRGMINVHASLLPAYRGAAPVHRAVIAGETETGVTIMRVVSELDAGPMLATARRGIGPDETSLDVERALADLGASALLDVVDQLADGRAVAIPQDHSRATYAPKIMRADGVIDWRVRAADIHNRVRGVHPWPLVSVSIGGSRSLLHRTTVTAERVSAEPGTVVHAIGDRFDVAAGDGVLLRVVTIQPEGRRVMTAREFLAGRHVAAGTRVTSP